MARLRPEDLNVSALPRSTLGHLKTDAVGDLLQQAAWDYRETLAENQQLARTVEELTQQVEETKAQVAALEEVVARRKDPDELARSLLASAQRAAREERDSARREAELVLKKAAQRVDKLEQEMARVEADRLAELARVEADHLAELVRLEELRDDLVARLRRMLETLASRYAPAQEDSLESDQAVAAGTQQ